MHRLTAHVNFAPSVLNEGCGRSLGLRYGEPWSTTLAVEALALEDVGSVSPILVPAVPAQDVDVLVVVRARMVSRANHDLPVPAPVARLGCSIAHSRQ